MFKVVIRPRAKKDLKDIWLYSFHEWGEAQADKYLADIESGIARLEENPQLGKSRDSLRSGYRSLRVNRHILYYILTPSTIDIVRVLHGRMDPERQLKRPAPAGGMIFRSGESACAMVDGTSAFAGGML